MEQSCMNRNQEILTQTTFYAPLYCVLIALCVKSLWFSEITLPLLCIV